MKTRKRMKKQQSCLMAKTSLPDEIITNDILPKLPVKSIFRFKSVSKTWYSLFSDPYFIKLHHNHSIQQNKFSLILNDFNNNRLYSIDYDSLASQQPLRIIDYPFISIRFDTLVFVDSCNGLICFTSHPGDGEYQIYLWNPSTDECTPIPPPPPLTIPILDDLESIEYTAVGFGFGYDFKLDVYKIFNVRSVSDDHGSFFTTVELYTLGSDSWKIINDKIPYKIIGYVAGVLVNGALHWTATALIEGPEKASYNAIVSFDVADETFKEVSIPKKLMNQNILTLRIGVLSEHLCIFDIKYKNRTDIWIMKEYGVSESWTKLFTILQCDIDIKSIPSMRLINSLKNGKILLQKDSDNIVLYDKQKRTTIPKLSDVGDHFDVITCVGSLVSLSSKTYLKHELGETPLRSLLVPQLFV